MTKMVDKIREIFVPFKIPTTVTTPGAGSNFANSMSTLMVSVLTLYDPWTDVGRVISSTLVSHSIRVTV